MKMNQALATSRWCAGYAAHLRMTDTIDNEHFFRAQEWLVVRHTADAGIDSGGIERRDFRRG